MIEDKKLEEILDLAVNTLMNQRPHSAPVTIEEKHFFEGENFFEPVVYNCLLDVSPLITCRRSEVKASHGTLACKPLMSDDLSSKSETQVHQGVDVYIPPLCLEQEDQEIGDVPNNYIPNSDSWSSDEIRVSSSTESLSRMQAPRLAWKYPELRLNLPKDEDDKIHIRHNIPSSSSSCSSLSISSSSSSSDCSSISYDKPLAYLSEGLDVNDTWLFDRIPFHPCLSTVMERQTTSTIVEEIESTDGQKSIDSFDMFSPDYVANIVKIVHETNNHFTHTNRSPSISSSCLTNEAEATEIKVEQTISKDEINQLEASKINITTSTLQNSEVGATIDKTDFESMIEHIDPAEEVDSSCLTNKAEATKLKVELTISKEKINQLEGSKIDVTPSTLQNSQAGTTISKTDFKSMVEYIDPAEEVNVLLEMTSGFEEDGKTMVDIAKNLEEITMISYSKNQVETENTINPVNLLVDTENLVMEPNEEITSVLSMPKEQMENDYSPVQIKEPIHSFQHNAVVTDKKKYGKILALGSEVRRSVSDVQVSKQGIVKDCVKKATSQIQISSLVAAKYQFEGVKIKERMPHRPDSNSQFEKTKSCEVISTFELDKKQVEIRKNRNQIYKLDIDKSQVDLEKSDVKIGFSASDTVHKNSDPINLAANLENKVSEAVCKESICTTSIFESHVGLLDTTISLSPQNKVIDQNQYTENEKLRSQGQVFTVTISSSLHWIFKTPNEMQLNKPYPLSRQNIAAINNDHGRTVNIKEDQAASIDNCQQVIEPEVSKEPASRLKSQLPVRKRTCATECKKQTRRPVATKGQVIQASIKKKIINSSTSEGRINSLANRKVVQKTKSCIPVAGNERRVKRVSYMEIADSPVPNHPMVEVVRDVEINIVTSPDELQESTHDLDGVLKNINDSNRKPTPEDLVTAVYIRSTKINLDESTCKSPKPKETRYKSPSGLKDLSAKPEIVADKKSDLSQNASPSTTIVSSMMTTAPELYQNHPHEIPQELPPESQREDISAQNRITCIKTPVLQSLKSDVPGAGMPSENLIAAEETCDTPKISVPIMPAENFSATIEETFFRLFIFIMRYQKTSLHCFRNVLKSYTPSIQSPHDEQDVKKKIEEHVSPVNYFNQAAESLNEQLESFVEDDDLGEDVESLHFLYNELMANKAFAEKRNENLHSSFKKECEMLKQIMKQKASMEDQLKGVKEQDACPENIEDFISLDEQLKSLKWLEEHQHNFISVFQREIENEAMLWTKLEENAKKKSAAKPKIEPRMTANALRLKFKNTLHKMEQVHEVNSSAVKSILARMTMLSVQDKQEILAMMATPQPPKESKSKQCKPSIKTQKRQQTLANKTQNADCKMNQANKRQNSVKVQVTGKVSSANRADHTVRMAKQLSPKEHETSRDQSTLRQNQVKSKALSVKIPIVKAARPKETLSGKTSISKFANDEVEETKSSLPYNNKIDFKKGGIKYQIKVGLNESALKNSKLELLPSISDESIETIVSKRPCNKVRLFPIATELEEDIVQATLGMEDIPQPSPLNATVVELYQDQETYLKAKPEHGIQKVEMLDKEMLTVKANPRQKKVHKNEAVKKVENKTTKRMSVKEVNCENPKEKELRPQRKKSIVKDVPNENRKGKSLVMKNAGEKVNRADYEFSLSSSSKLDIISEPLEYEEQKSCIPVNKLSNLAKTEAKRPQQLISQKANLSHQQEALNHVKKDRSGIQSTQHKPIIKSQSFQSHAKPNSITKLRQNMSKIINSPIIDPSKNKGTCKMSGSGDGFISNFCRDNNTYEVDTKIIELTEAKGISSSVHQPISAPKDRGCKVPPIYADWEPPEPMQKQLERYATHNAVKTHKDQAKAKQPRSRNATPGKLLPQRENMPQPKVTMPLSANEKTRKREKASSSDDKSAVKLPPLKVQPKKYLLSGSTYGRKSING
ncbi:hypothetical protein ACJMK2_010565 [Sinanodonta woodiana]|uniref:Uncharacterized protein n=1 Tax=Sinanodonta woodiana TaxID=1069815 RepID=A0ABD3VFV0_SINWO